MNAERRKKLKNVIDNLNAALSSIEEIKDEEQDSYDNLPEGIQDGERGDQMQENIDNLDTAYNDLDDVITELQEVIDA